MNPLNLKKGALFGAVVAMVASTIFATPAQAAADDLITPRNEICEFAAASLGHGSATDPILIGTPKQLAELSDCSARRFSITGISTTGTTATYTADNSFGVGQIINIENVDPSTFNRQAVRVTAATSTTFTIASTNTDTYVSGGDAEDRSTFYSIVADIDLSTGNESWNNIDTSTITNASGDGSTITFTGANTFEAGQNVVIKNVNPIEYSVGATTIVSATATEFTVSGSASATYVSGGVANSNGWLPISNTAGAEFRNSTIMGNGRTITGLTIHRDENYLGLFGDTDRVNFHDLNLTDVDVDATSSSDNERIGGLVGRSDDSSFNNISVTGTVIGSYAYVGLLVGDANDSSAIDIEIAGDVRLARTNTFSNTTYLYAIGGVVGDFGGTMANIRSSADVYGFLTNNVDASVAYSNTVGGIVGSHEGTLIDSYATGDVVGGRSVGGVIGYTCCGDIASTYATGTVSGLSSGERISQIGGLIGSYGCCGAVRDSYSTGDVIVNNTFETDTYTIGGLLGSNDCCSAVINSYSTGDVLVTVLPSRPAFDIGGFTGSHDCCNNIQYSYSTGDVTVNNGYNVGGFIGRIDSSEIGIFDSYSTGDVTVSYDGDANVGGFIGQVQYDLALVRSYATGNVTVTPLTEGETARRVGGLIGYHRGDGALNIVDSYYVGAVSGSDYVAGLLGWASLSNVATKNVYVSATVTATGTNAIVDPVSNGYFATALASNMFDSTAAGTSNTGSNFAGKTTSQLTTKATFTDLGWHFAAENGVWKIASDVNAGMPTLVGPQAAGGTTPEVVQKSVSLSSKNGVLTLSKLTKFKVRSYTVNLPNTFAKKQVKVRVLRAGKVVKILKMAKLNKGGNITFISKYSLKKGDVVQVADSKKVRANVTFN